MHHFKSISHLVWKCYGRLKFSIFYFFKKSFLLISIQMRQIKRHLLLSLAFLNVSRWCFNYKQSYVYSITLKFQHSNENRWSYKFSEFHQNWTKIVCVTALWILVIAEFWLKYWVFFCFNMIFEGNNFINAYNLRFFSSTRTHSFITNGIWLKYLMKKEYTNLSVCRSKKVFFCKIAKTRANWAKWW